MLGLVSLGLIQLSQALCAHQEVSCWPFPAPWDQERVSPPPPPHSGTWCILSPGGLSVSQLV